MNEHQGSVRFPLLWQVDPHRDAVPVLHLQRDPLRRPLLEEEGDGDDEARELVAHFWTEENLHEVTLDFCNQKM